MSLLFAAFLWLGYVNPGIANEDVSQIVVASDVWDGYAEADGVGLYWDLLRMIYGPLGIEVEHEIAPYARTVYAVQIKKVDAMLGPYKNEFGDALFSEWHIDRDNVVAVSLQAERIAWGKGIGMRRRVCWKRGYAYNVNLDYVHNFCEINNEEDGMRMVSRGMIDFFLSPRSEVEDVMRKQGMDKSLYRLEPVPEASMNIYVAFAETDRGRLLLRIFDARMAELYRSGELWALYDKWKYGAKDFAILRFQNLLSESERQLMTDAPPQPMVLDSASREALRH